MAQKYEIYHETGWDDKVSQPIYERLTTFKNERAAIDFINNVDNVGKYGNMLLFSKVNGKMLVYNDQRESWE